MSKHDNVTVQALCFFLRRHRGGIKGLTPIISSLGWSGKPAALDGRPSKEILKRAGKKALIMAVFLVRIWKRNSERETERLPDIFQLPDFSFSNKGVILGRDVCVSRNVLESLGCAPIQDVVSPFRGSCPDGRGASWAFFPRVPLRWQLAK